MSLLAASHVGAQLPPTPGPQDLARGTNRLWLNYLDAPFCIFAPGPNGTGPSIFEVQYFLHTDPDEPCGSFADEPRTVSNVANGRPYRAQLNPPPARAFRLAEGGTAVADLWVAHRMPSSILPAHINVLNVEVRLLVGDLGASTGWTGVADPTAVLSGERWYHFVFAIPVPATDASLADVPLVLEVRQNACPLGLVGAEEIPACIATQGPMPNSIGYQWYVGFSGDHRSFLDVPLQPVPGA